MNQSVIESYQWLASKCIEIALDKEPRLTRCGIGIQMPRGHFDIQPRDEFLEAQDQLRGSVDQVAASVIWLEQIYSIRSLNRKRTSYSYKHLVEHYHREQGMPCYVSNGAFIAAALGHGLNVKHECPGSPNVFVNISERAIQRLHPGR